MLSESPLCARDHLRCWEYSYCKRDNISALMELVSCLPAVLLSSGCTNKMQTGWFKQQDLLSHSCGGWSPRSRCWQAWFLLRFHLFGLQMAVFSVCPHMVFLLCKHIPDVSLYVQISSPYKDISQIGLRPILRSKWPHFNLTTSLRALSPNIVTFWGNGG